MRFLKESVTLILIIVFLIVIDFYISNYTRQSIEKVDSQIDGIIQNALNEEKYDKTEELKKIEYFQKEWKNIEDKLSYFAEHEELEKVSVLIIGMKANVEADMIEDSYEKMHEIKFRIQHIKAKQKLKLNNIF